MDQKCTQLQAQGAQALAAQGNLPLPDKPEWQTDQQVLSSSPLFSGIEPDFLLPLLTCLQVQKRRCHKGQFIFSCFC